MPSNALELRGVAHSFDDHLIFEDIGLAVRRGELVSLLGASGSGKTTLLRAVAGFVTPSQGSIWINGLEVAHSGVERVPPERRNRSIRQLAPRRVRGQQDALRGREQAQGG